MQHTRYQSLSLQESITVMREVEEDKKRAYMNGKFGLPIDYKEDSAIEHGQRQDA